MGGGCLSLQTPAEVQDTHLLMVITTGPGDLYTKQPVRKLADLKGMEIRATGLSAATLKNLGAIPVAMPQSEAYESLSKGVVKGNLGPIEVLQGWKQAEVTKYITRTPFLYNTLFFVTMNNDKWNSLSPDLQATIEKVTAEYFEQTAAGHDRLCKHINDTNYWLGIGLLWLAEWTHCCGIHRG